MRKALRKHERLYKMVRFALGASLVLLMTAGASFAQIVSGTVKSPDGESIPGVNIILKGTNTGTVSDIDGRYSLEVSDLNGTLVFTYIGLATIEGNSNGRSSIDVTLQEVAHSLDEVVVVGYSTQKRADITGAVSVVDMGGLNKSTPGNAEQALQGMAAGVNVINSGVPGAASKVLVRGVTSCGNTGPLVIVDGIEQSLHLINRSDIASIQVLKDAGAAAIYGVRGANGVIIVTTKKGKVGDPVISYD